MVSRADVERWRALADAATPGPWRACTWDVMERPHVHKDRPDQTHCECGSDLPITRDDAAFIAASREAVPAMADMLGRFAALVEGAQMDGHEETCPWCGHRIAFRTGVEGYEPRQVIACPLHFPDCEAAALLREWHGEEATGGDDAVDGARDGA